MQDITKYVVKFEKLKRGITKYGKAPHKVVLLLSILQAVNKKLILENRIFITPELVLLFRSNWYKLVSTSHVCIFALPFWHLKGDGFWHLYPREGFDTFLKIKESVSSLNELNLVVEFGFLEEELFNLMLDQKSNLVLQSFLLDEYFPEKKFGIESDGNPFSYFSELEGKILNEDRETYINEMKVLIQNSDEEEVFLRGSLFKKEIPKIYNNTCCISGMRITQPLQYP